MQRILDQEDGYDDYYNEGNISNACTSWAPGVGFAGIVCAVVFASELNKARFSFFLFSSF